MANIHREPDPSTTRQLPLRLPGDTYDALKATAFFTQRSMNDIVTEALNNYLAEAGRREQLDAVVSQAQVRYRTVLDKLGNL